MDPRLKTAALLLREPPLALKYVSGGLFPVRSDDVHLDAAIAWLRRAQDACGGRGVSAVYDLRQGWQIAYPETSGYIIATYLEYGETARAIDLGDWEVEIQSQDGGVFSSMEARQTRVFNTGQVILGWLALFEKTGDRKYLDAAIRAGEFLRATQESDGRWVQNTHCGARTYHARVAWALLRLAKLTDDRQFADAAIRNLRWILRQQTPNGWFDQCGFEVERPNTHVIAYTMRGLLESHAFAPELGLLDAVGRAADGISRPILECPIRGIDGMAPSTYDANWLPVEENSCLTGNAQLAIVFYRLGRRETADLLLKATRRTQLVRGKASPILGAIPGSYPFFEGYHANSYPNWAAKFFADALMMKRRPGLAIQA